MGRVRDYAGLMQLRIVALLSLSSIAGFVIAYTHWNVSLLPALVFAVLGVTIGGMGSELINKVLEIDIDSKMARTSKRSSVAGKISPLLGIALGVALVSAGIVIGGLANWLTSLMIALGIAFYVLVYTALLKRTSRFSIIIGGLAGSFAVWAGVTAAAGTMTLAGFILGMLVLFWIPGHIWSLALKYRKDYLRVHVPMLTAIESPRRSAIIIAACNVMMGAVSLLLGAFMRIYYTAIIAIPLLVMLYLSYRASVKHSAVRMLFKFSSIYLAFVFIAVLAARML